MKPPDWKDGKRLFEWTLAQLGPQQGPDQPRKGSSPHQYMIDVLKACERHDADAFVKAIKDPRAARFAFLMLTVEDDEIIAIDFLETGEAKIGRVKKPRLKKTNYVAFGSTLVTVINDIWDEQYGKHQRRDNPPRASEIAAYYLSEKGTRVSAGQIDAFRRKYGAP